MFFISQINFGYIIIWKKLRDYIYNNMKLKNIYIFKLNLNNFNLCLIKFNLFLIYF
jgi:hypothetical protein